MAAKIILLVSLNIFTISVLSAPTLTIDNELCKCEGEDSAEMEELWKFLKEISPDLEDFPVAPGQLSPNIPCSNCIEYSRQKRKTISTDFLEKNGSEEAPHPAAEKDDGDESIQKTEKEDSKPKSEEDSVDSDQILNQSFGVLDSSCPEGTMRVGIWCVSDSDYYE